MATIHAPAAWALISREPRRLKRNTEDAASDDADAAQLTVAIALHRCTVEADTISSRV